MSPDLIIIPLMFVVLYIFFIRPKQKEVQKAEEMRKNLKKGDQVVTIGGMMGTVHSVSDHSVIVKAEENTRIEFEKSAIARVIVNNG